MAGSSERTISIYNIHTKETVTAVFKRNGRFVEAGLAEINQAMRDHRRNEATRMDPELIDLLWQVHAELGSKEPIYLISGYRSRATNDQLRRSVGGQASESRHILGKAADVHFPDVPVKKIRYSALIQEKGGVGYYPTSALPFVHIDTDRVRSWPRLPRHELALLFPKGFTRHAAADGGSITPDDVRAARDRHADLAQQVAAFHGERLAQKSAVAVASAASAPEPGATRQRIAALPRAMAGAGMMPNLFGRPAMTDNPQLIDPPALVAPANTNLRPQRAALINAPASPSHPSPSSADRARLAELATLATIAPQLVAGPSPAVRQPQLVAANLPGLPSLTGASLPVPPEIAMPSPPSAPERQVASLGPTTLPSAPTDVASSAGRFGWGGSGGSSGWIPAPAYDDEHPDELSYRPFPILPYLTETATEPLMSELTKHDVARTFDSLDQPDQLPTLRFRPTAQVAGALWAQQFTGSALALDRLHEAKANPPSPANAVLNRLVQTSQR